MQRRSSKNKNNTALNANEKKWVSWLSNQPCCISGETHNVSLHHCMGSTGSHNKVHIGHYFQIPLHYEYHQGNFGIHAPHVGRTAWVQARGLESRHWRKLAEKYMDEGGQFDHGVFESIMDCGK